MCSLLVVPWSHEMSLQGLKMIQWYFRKLTSSYNVFFFFNEKFSLSFADSSNAIFLRIEDFFVILLCRIEARTVYCHAMTWHCCVSSWTWCLRCLFQPKCFSDSVTGTWCSRNFFGYAANRYCWNDPLGSANIQQCQSYTLSSEPLPPCPSMGGISQPLRYFDTWNQLFSERHDK